MNKSFQSLEDLNNSKNPCHFLFGLMIFDFLQNKIQYPQFHLPKLLRFSCGTTNDDVVIEIFSRLPNPCC